MNYCLDYFNTSRHLNDFNEVILKYDHKTINIISHVQDNYKQEQRVILNVQELLDEDFEQSLEYIAAAAQVHPKLAILGQITQLPRLKETGLNYFFPNVVNSWDTLNGYINMGVSDVYIGNEFAFNMINISKVCKESNVAVRVFANVAQTDCSATKGAITNFFIRPEDVHLYEEEINVIEFYGTKDRQDVLYEIYTEGSWKGNLNELIIGLEDVINNNLIMGCFGVLRRACGKRCAYSSLCDVCHRFVSTQETIGEHI